MDRVILIDRLFFIATLMAILWAGWQIWRSAQSTKGRRTHYQRSKKAGLIGLPAIVNYLWRKQYRLCILIAGIIGSWIVVFADNLLKLDNIKPKDELSALALVVTGAVVFWSTREAYDLKNISQDSKSIQQSEFDFANRPYLRLVWAGRTDGLLHLVNEGKGLAIDITFEPKDIEDGVPFKPLRRPLLSPGDSSPITLSELQQGAGKLQLTGYGEYTYDVREEIGQKLKDGEFGKVHVAYKDLRDQVYDAIFVPDERYNDRFNIEKQSKRKT